MVPYIVQCLQNDFFKPTLGKGVGTGHLWRQDFTTNNLGGDVSQSTLVGWQQRSEPNPPLRPREARLEKKKCTGTPHATTLRVTSTDNKIVG